MRASLALILVATLASVSQAQNLLDNGDFDTDVSGWSANSGFVSHDPDEGAGSGPGSLFNATNSAESSARQCVENVTGGIEYDFGASFRLDSGGPINHCRVQLDEYDSTNCTGSSTSQLGSVQQTIVFNSATYTDLASSHTFEATTRSVRVRLDCDKNTPSHAVNWDDAFLRAPTPESTRYTLVAGQSATLYHLPGANGLLGDSDDVELADPTALIGSDPNYRGSFSYLGGTLPGAAAEPGLPDGFNTAIFLEGTVDYAPGFGAVASDIVHTGHRQGLGIQALFQLTPDVVGTPNGTFLELDAPFLPTGNSYVDNVLIPKATELGAEGMLFVDATGTLQPSPIVPVPISGRGVIFGVRGVPGLPARGGAEAVTRGSDFSDLVVSKTANVTGLQPPGTFVTYTLTVRNDGPAEATGVLLKDRLLPGLSYLLNDCGAPAPVAGVFTWPVGSLANGGQATCIVTARALDATNFDVPNAAVAFGNEWDPDRDSNVSEVTVEILDDSTLGIEQLPNLFTGFPSDLDCDGCPAGEQAIAGAFKVDSTAQICSLTFYGGYNDNSPFFDNFRIEIYDDNRQTPGVPGVPGQLVTTLTGAGFQQRTATGDQVDGQFDEYRYRVSLLIGTGPILPRGKYWLLILNDSSTARGNGDWFWESGASDVLGRTLSGTAYNPAISTIPAGWGLTAGLNPAFEVCLDPVDTSVFEDGFETGDTSMWQ